MQPAALGRKASDEFAVPLCRIHQGLATVRRAELAECETSMTTAHDLAVRRTLEAAGVEFIDEANPRLKGEIVLTNIGEAVGTCLAKIGTCLAKKEAFAAPARFAALVPVVRLQPRALMSGLRLRKTSNKGRRFAAYRKTTHE